ncbi:MAG: hypothetical protein ACRDI0_12860 [Actinomycetota bacterium]
MRRVIVGLLAAALSVGLAPAALAEETVCKGTIGAKTLDNVKVPQGATCVLKGTKVKGTVKVNKNAVLDAVGVNVIGNVQGENAKNVIVRAGSSVGGSVQVVQGSRGKVAKSKIGGDILYDEQSGLVKVRNSTTGGNVQAFQNTGGVVIEKNVIGGNLQCKENKPKPTGGGNKVDGNKEDQCKNL